MTSNGGFVTIRQNSTKFFRKDKAMENLTKEQAYNKMEETLLPVFRQAVELCKYLNNDQDFFKEGYNQVKLFSMALVSLAIKEVNANSGTIDEKKEALLDMDYWSTYFIKDGQHQKAGYYHDWKNIEEFRNEICRATNIPVDDNYETRYLGAFKRDIGWWGKEPLISTSGEILDWSKMQDSHVFEAVSRRGGLNDTKENNVKRYEKIKEFCDLKISSEEKTELEQRKEQIRARLHERDQGGADAKGLAVNDELVKMHDSIGIVTPEKAKTLSPIIKEAILEKRKNKK